MVTRLAMAIVAAALLLPAAAPAQRTPRPLPPVSCYPFACPPRPMPYRMPSAEALALGRRIARVVDDGALARRTDALVRSAQVREAPRPPVRNHPDGPIRAVPPVDLANYPMWGFVLAQRVLDHAALFYAARYTLDELRTMAAFFESSAGAKLVSGRTLRSAELEEALSTDLLEDDLWNVACGTPVRQEVEDGPHHQFDRLHPPVDFPPSPRPAWCSAGADAPGQGAE